MITLALPGAYKVSAVVNALPVDWSMEVLLETTTILPGPSGKAP